MAKPERVFVHFDWRAYTDYTLTPIYDKKEKMQNKALFSPEDAAITIGKIDMWCTFDMWLKTKTFAAKVDVRLTKRILKATSLSTHIQ